MAGDRTRITTTGALGAGGDLRAAAAIVKDRAERIAGGWSETIPFRIEMEVAGKVATLSCDAPAAYPNEIAGVRHPVFAEGTDRSKWTWVLNQHRPFLSAAADQTAGEAMARYAKKIDRMCRQAGFR